MTVETLERELNSLWAEDREWAIARLAECGDPGIQMLIRVAGRRWGATPAVAIEALGRIGDRRACEVVRHAIGSRRRCVWQAAIVAAGRLGDDRVVPTLCELCARPTWDGARPLAAWALGEIGSPTALPTLLGLMCVGDHAEREQAQRGLVRIGSRHPEKLARELGSASHGAIAAGVLNDLGDEAIPGLEAVFASDYQPAARRAMALLGAMGRAQREHLEPLLQALDDRDPTFRTAAATGLAHLASQAPDLHLRQTLPDLRQWEKTSHSPLERRYYRHAIDAIERSTCHLKELPVPVDTAAEASASLPVPATPATVDLDLLPRTPHRGGETS